MKLYCPHCGVKGVADDSYRGKKIKCPKCMGIFVATEPVAAGREAEELAAALATEEPVAAERAENLESGDEVPQERLPEDVAPAATLPEKAEGEAPREVTGRETVEEEIAAAPPEREAQEMVLDWDEIVSEIEAKTAAGHQEEAAGKEDLPASLAVETDGKSEDPAAGEISPGPEFVQPAEGQDGLTPGEAPRTAAEADAGEEPPPAGTKPEENRESHFIFEDQAPVQAGENEPAGLNRQQCWQCGKSDQLSERSGLLYCPDCLPADVPAFPASPAFAGLAGAAPTPEEDAAPAAFAGEAQGPRLTVGGALREAWEKTRGAKGPILAGSAVMYLTVLFLAAGASFVLPMFGQDLAGPNIGIQIASYLLQSLTDIMSVLFTAGLLVMGIRKVAGDPISWRMIFSGFPDAGKIIVATILQSLLIFIGVLILVLPGIYLAIGYSMTIPLIVDRKMSPWQAMETSRKAIHPVWWRVFGIYVLMGLLFAVSMVPLGIGLIWTWPMFVILAGVIYRSLFGWEK